MLPFASRRPLLATSRRRTPLKAALRPEIRRDLQDIVALVPYIGAQVPEEAKTVAKIIRGILPAPPPRGGVPFAPPPHALGLEQPHFLLTPELTVFMVSDTLQAVLGMEQREFRRHWREHLEAADTQTLQAEFEQAMTTHEGFSERVHWQTVDGLRGSTLRITPRFFHDTFVGFTGVLFFDRAA